MLKSFIAVLALVSASIVVAAPPVQIVSPEREAVLRSHLPKVESPETAALLAADDLVFYSEAEMPRVYQHSGTVHDAFYNISASKPLEKFGNANREFPWGFPAGTHLVPNLAKFGFFRLPKDATGKVLPIVYHRDGDGYAWTFPKGTVFAEVLMLPTPNAADDYRTFELRVRRREDQTWSADAFRPFPTADKLVRRIKALRPEWEKDTALKAAVDSLMSPKFSASAVKNTHPAKQVFSETAASEELAALPADLVNELLDTPFQSAAGLSWRENLDKQIFAPTTLASYHVIPTSYRANYVAVDSLSCTRCHADTNQEARSFEQNRDWYGRVRGSDGIISFHPFDRNRVSHNGFSTGTHFNPQFVSAGILERFDARKHTDAIYRGLELPYKQYQR